MVICQVISWAGRNDFLESPLVAWKPRGDDKTPSIHAHMPYVS